MLYLTCSTIISVDLAHYGVSRAKDWVSVDCGTSDNNTMACPPVRGDNPRALASGLSPAQVGKPWYNYFIPPSS